MNRVYICSVGPGTNDAAQPVPTKPAAPPMASAAARSGLRSLAVRAAPLRRRMSSSVHDDAYETAKWEKITYAGIVTCTLLAAYNLSKGHPHFDEPPAYPYLHIRNKEFPWGPDGLFETKDHH